MEKKRTPRLRFRGFTDDWEQRKLKELVKEIKRTDPNSSAPIMMITANDGFINQSERYSTDNAGKSLQKYILLRKGELAYNHGASKLRPYGSCFALLDEKNARIPYVYHCFSCGNENPEFLSLVLNSKAVERQLRKLVSSGARMDGLLNITFDDYTSVPVMMPSRSEQKQIANYIHTLNHLITLHQRKYDMLKKVKKAMLEKMFPKNGKRVPEIRFAGFTDDWEQRKLSEMVIRYEDPIVTPHDGYTRLGIRSHAKGTFYEYVAPGHELETAQMHRVAADKLIFNITFAWEHAVAITTKDDAGKLVSHRFPQFTLSESLRPEFLKYIILDEGFHHNLYLASPGGAGRNRVLKIDEALDYPICFPSFEEQHKIGEFLNKLSNLITLHQRKLEKLQNLKKALLKKMFI